MLTDAKLRKLKPELTSKRHSDEKGLYLEVTPKGQMYWRLKYRLEGRENRASFGVYPEVSLAEARAKRDEARCLLQQGINLNHAKKIAKRKASPNTFERVGREWLLDRQPTIKPFSHQRDMRTFEHPEDHVPPETLLNLLRKHKTDLLT